jgi:hypothetical protein
MAPTVPGSFRSVYRTPIGRRFLAYDPVREVQRSRHRILRDNLADLRNSLRPGTAIVLAAVLTLGSIMLPYAYEPASEAF